MVVAQILKILQKVLSKDAINYLQSTITRKAIKDVNIKWNDAIKAINKAFKITNKIQDAQTAYNEGTKFLEQNIITINDYSQYLIANHSYDQQFNKYTKLMKAWNKYTTQQKMDNLIRKNQMYINLIGKRNERDTKYSTFMDSLEALGTQAIITRSAFRKILK